MAKTPRDPRSHLRGPARSNPKRWERDAPTVVQTVVGSGPGLVLRRRRIFRRGSHAAGESGVTYDEHKKKAPPALAHGRGRTKPDEGMGANSFRSSRGFSGGATRTSALRRPGGPFLGLRGAPRTQTRPRSCGHGFRTTRAAFRRPPGSRVAEPLEPAFAGRGPSLRFRSLPKVYRSAPAPSRRPEGLHGRTMLPLVDSPALRHMTEQRTRIPRGFRPRCAPRPGFGYPHRGIHHRSSRHLAAPERP